MDLQVLPFHDTLEQTWDDFIERNNRNATFLHSRRFFNHNPANKTDDASLLFYKDTKLVAVLPATLSGSGGNRRLVSHPRSTYGGYVLDPSTGVEEAIALVAATIAFAREQGVAEIIINNPFRVYHRIPSDETNYALWYHGFSIRSRKLETVIPLREDARSFYNDSTLRSVKKAWKAVTVAETDDYESYWNILTANLQEKHQTEPTHTLEEFRRLLQLVGDGQIRLIGGFAGSHLVGGIVLFVTHPITLHAQYIASDNNFQHLRPMNAIIDYLVDWGYRNGYSYLNLGTANEEDSYGINYGLFRFKEGFGGRGVLRESMHLKLTT
ncbi:MAG TPA: GNAT family N-acetyltransferase [Lacibacter sp.]|nr:GNAT family N-acetyltransferase [Lacibacter sp.]HMO90218.1 GNAT family N-acetyltransferase [Lacibacter sp.]HMP86272.1 GNAT family N-acetyltransferase [Lacibacter sp.]